MTASEAEDDLAFSAFLTQMETRNHKNKLIYTTKTVGLYQNKVTSSLAAIQTPEVRFSNVPVT